jgi:formate dehydrogenase major subunit
MGWTQHTVGVQNIRAMAIIQLLLGNMGMAGGGVNALRGESNVQGSTDHGLLFHICPAICRRRRPRLRPWPTTMKRTPQSKDPKSANWWQNKPKYMASLLAPSTDRPPLEEAAMHWMPKIDDGKNYSWLTFSTRCTRASSRVFRLGPEPGLQRRQRQQDPRGPGQARLDGQRQSVLERDRLLLEGPGMDPEKIKTEVFFLPCAVSMEKEGSISNSGRWMQWRYKGR